MLVSVLGTGSKGNCYILKASDGQTLMLDAGLPKKQILKGLDFNVMDLQGICVSHVHYDHFMSAMEFQGMGIPVFMPFTDENQMQKAKLGDFTVYSFPLVHDVPCVGFYITHKEMGSLIYLTDSEYCRFRFPKVNHIMVEMNYDADLMDPSHPAKEHIFRGHMEKRTTLAFLQANMSEALRTVILCHMSIANIMPNEVLEETQMLVGKGVQAYIAEKGLSVTLNLCCVGEMREFRERS